MKIEDIENNPYYHPAITAGFPPNSDSKAVAPARMASNP